MFQNLVAENQVKIIGREGQGLACAAEAKESRRIAERLAMDKHVLVLGTLGNNIPFIGLFGTVLGIIKAFNDLALAGTGEGNQNDLTLHFGLGAEAGPAELAVRWPDGSQQLEQNVRPDRLIVIQPQPNRSRKP